MSVKSSLSHAESNGKLESELPFGNRLPETKPAAEDPFDPATLRISQDFAATVGVKKALLTLKVMKPAREWYVRCHPSEDYRIQTAVVELKEDREVYLVAPALWGELSTEVTFSPRLLVTSVTRQGVPFLWPIKLPGADGRQDEWSRSMLDAATMAADRWVRVVANMHLGAYDVFYATADLPEPNWPDKSLGELLKIAFRDRFIDTLDHAVLKKLRGEL